eukprot:evm.model.NODE_42098_length_28510_cov_28.859102.4
MQQACTLSSAGDEALASYQGEKDVTPAQLRAAHAVLKEAGQEREDAFNKAVIRGARPVFPRHVQRKEDLATQAKAKEGWRQRLQAKHQKREYDRLVKNVHWGGTRKPDPETRPFYQASIAFNMLVAMITAGFMGWYVAGSFVTKDSHRLMVGIVTAMAMLVLEMTLYIIRMTEVERYAPKRERNEQLGQQGKTIPSGYVDDLTFRRPTANKNTSIRSIVAPPKVGGVKQKVL